MNAPKKVYRFKVAMKHRKGLWREIEVRSSQTLGDLDGCIREAFQHETQDHLSEFYEGKVWKSRGYGEIYPSGGGEGSSVVIGKLGLQEGSTMEYVYDFGDDVRHIVTLERIFEEEAPTGEYPRVVSKNRPRYHYCVNCDKADRGKTVATLVCIDCSNEEGPPPAYLCENCAHEHDEEHHIENVVC